MLGVFDFSQPEPRYKGQPSHLAGALLPGDLPLGKMGSEVPLEMTGMIFSLKYFSTYYL